MKLEGKTIIVTSNSSVFLKLTKMFIEKSGKPRSDFIIVAENGLLFKERFRKRRNKIGLLAALDEWIYDRYEQLFNHWEKAERELLNDIVITRFKVDIITDSVNRSNSIVSEQLKSNYAKNIISIGSGYIPKRLLEQYAVKINIHPGILPNYKGIGTPEAIMNFENSKLGWSIHELTPQIDSGKIFCIKKMNFNELKKMSFARLYIYIYKDAICDYFSNTKIITNSDFVKIESESKENSFVRFSKFMKYKIEVIKFSVKL
jgi:hypothetical protein